MSAAPTICDCGLIPLPVGVLANSRDGVTHRPDPQDCTPDGPIVVNAPTLAEGLHLLPAAVVALKTSAPT